MAMATPIPSSTSSKNTKSSASSKQSVKSAGSARQSKPRAKSSRPRESLKVRMAKLENALNVQHLVNLLEVNRLATKEATITSQKARYVG